MRPLELVKYQSLVDVIDWDSDLQRWTIRVDELDSLVFTTSDACSGCRNNPKNGGSGICHCILGATPIT